MPSWAPAKTVRGSVGCTVRPNTRLSFQRLPPARRQVSPPSGLSQAPVPTVPTQIVKLPLIACPPNSTAVPAEAGTHLSRAALLALWVPRSEEHTSELQ